AHGPRSRRLRPGRAAAMKLCGAGFQPARMDGKSGRLETGPTENRMGFTNLLPVLLLLVPAAAAITAALLGRNRLEMIRWLSFGLTLGPLFLLMGMWGGPACRHAARKFFISTLTGSLITFLGLLALIVVCFQTSRELTFSIPDLVRVVNMNLASGADRDFWQS